MAIDAMRGIAETCEHGKQGGAPQRERRRRFDGVAAERRRSAVPLLEPAPQIEPLPADQRLFKNVEEWI